MKIDPIKPEERPHCAYCGKGLAPWTEEVRLRIDGTEHRVIRLEIAQQIFEAEFKTNKRIIRRVVTHADQYGEGDDQYTIVGRRPHYVTVTLFPEPYRYGRDGKSTFCTGRCAEAFAHAAHRGGFRMVRKENT